MVMVLATCSDLRTDEPSHSFEALRQLATSLHAGEQELHVWYDDDKCRGRCTKLREHLRHDILSHPLLRQSPSVTVTCKSHEVSSDDPTTTAFKCDSQLSVCNSTVWPSPRVDSNFLRVLSEATLCVEHVWLFEMDVALIPLRKWGSTLRHLDKLLAGVDLVHSGSDSNLLDGPVQGKFLSHFMPAHRRRVYLYAARVSRRFVSTLQSYASRGLFSSRRVRDASREGLCLEELAYATICAASSCVERSLVDMDAVYPELWGWTPSCMGLHMAIERFMRGSLPVKPQFVHPFKFDTVLDPEALSKYPERMAKQPLANIREMEWGRPLLQPQPHGNVTKAWAVCRDALRRREEIFPRPVQRFQTRMQAGDGSSRLEPRGERRDVSAPRLHGKIFASPFQRLHERLFQRWFQAPRGGHFET